MLPITPFPNGVSEDSYSSTREGVRALVEQGLSLTRIARELRVSKPTVCYHMRALGIKGESKFSRRYDWAEIGAHYAQGHSMRECQERFGFSGAAWSDAVERGEIVPRPRAAAIETVFASGARRNRFHLKRRLVGDGLRRSCCEQCGISDWRGAPLCLELHHVNGDGHDNRLENLRLLCPNCHSQTDNWGGRAKAGPTRKPT